jgi:uncharacterized protein
MAIYAISDLHLALSIDKPMDIFGNRWTNYMDRIKSEWLQTVGEEDWVILPGDISWATYLEQAVADFRYIDSLPGRKIISKGNHDYWWTTHSKLEKFLEENALTTIRFMHNNSFRLGHSIICGTRGWDYPGEEGSAEDQKIYKRELQRLELSLKSVEREPGDELLVALHYPPFSAKREPGEFVNIMSRYGVKQCIYGHLHGEGFRNAVEGEINGIRFYLVSSDYLYFKPLRLGE